MKTQHHIAIIGGGFSGTMTAVNLARFCEVPLRVTLINHGYPQGRGVAYSTRRPEHLLNVAARNLSALPEHPNHFVEWLRTRTEYAEMPDAELQIASASFSISRRARSSNERRSGENVRPPYQPQTP